MSLNSSLEKILNEVHEINIREKLKEIAPTNKTEENIAEIKDLLEQILEELRDVNIKLDINKV